MNIMTLRMIVFNIIKLISDDTKYSDHIIKNIEFQKLVAKLFTSKHNVEEDLSKVIQIVMAIVVE